MSKMGMGLHFNKVQQFDINRRVIAHSTTRAWKQVPHVSFVYEPDVTDLWNYFQSHKEEYNKYGKITFNTIMLKIISQGLIASPILNAIVDYNQRKKIGQIKYSKDINIAIPWLLEDGRMITPVVKNVEEKSLPEIAEYIKDLTRRIENTDIDAMQYFIGFKESLDEILHFRFGVIAQILAAKFGKHRLRKPTFKQKRAYKKINKNDKINDSDIFDASVLVSNFGSVLKNQKGFCSLLEIITPQVFVIGINAVQERPIVVKDEATNNSQIAIRKVLPMCLTFDHRVADLANIIPFQNKLETIFANPTILEDWMK